MHKRATAKDAELIEQVKDCECIYTIRYSYLDTAFLNGPYTVDFEVFEPGVSADFDDDPEVLNQASPEFTGHIKWDGCTEITHECFHMCSYHDLRTFQKLVAHITIRAHGLMGHFSDFDFDPAWSLLPLNQ